MSDKYANDEDVIMASVEPEGGEEKTLVYPTSTASTSIAEDAFKCLSDEEPQPEYVIVLTETIERSKGILKGGVNLGIGFLGLGNIKFERKPEKEVRTVKKVMYRNPDKK